MVCVFEKQLRLDEMEYLLFEILYRGLNYEKMRTTKHIKSKQIIELRKHMALLKMVLHLDNAIYYKLGNDYCKAIKNNITSIIKNDPEYAVKYYHPLFINDNADLKSLKSKVLSIDESICDVDDVISSIKSSTQTQEDKIESLESLKENINEYISDVMIIDQNAADAINKSKNDFYNKYEYLTPECEKSRWEKFKDGCKKVGEWCKNHWKELVIGAICIVIGAVLTVLTGGSFLAALGIGFKAAAMAGFISGGISVMSSLIVSIFSGDSFKTILGKVLRSFVDGFASGFMWGGIFAGGAQTISAILKFSRSGKLIFGGEQLQLFKPNNFSGKTLGKIKIWSPNGLNNPNSGGTLFKIGKTFRLDFEAGKQLFHTHITYNLYNSMPIFMKSMKWIFDPAKRDVHVRLTSILGGVIGVTQKE